VSSEDLYMRVCDREVRLFVYGASVELLWDRERMEVHFGRGSMARAGYSR
jgi:hypothetical protein